MAEPTYPQLLGIMAAKDRQIAQLQAHDRQLETRVRQLEAQNAGLQARIVQLERLLETATRHGKRQAAPFSKGPPKDKPRKPGRKSGTKYGSKAHRPLPNQEPDEIIDVPLPAHCDACGGAVD